MTPVAAAREDRRGLRVGIVLLAWSVPALLAAAQRYVFAVPEPGQAPVWRLVLAQVPGWYLWAALTPVIGQVTRRVPLRGAAPLRTASIHLALCFGCQVAHALVYTLTAAIAGTIPSRYTTAGYVWPTVLSYLPLMTVVYAAVVGVTEWLGAEDRERDAAIRAAELAGALSDAQLQALRMQLQPHFLFNTLNTIGTLVREHDAETASRVVAKLGDVLRAVLAAPTGQERPLYDELALLGDYLEIEQVRFADRLRVTWELDEAALDVLVPVLVLQPLVENALRHGIARESTAGCLEIGARREDGRLLLWVRDDGPGRPVAEDAAAERSGREHGGVGLANTRARLARLYGDAARLQLMAAPDRGAVAQIEMPARVRVP